jgi:hypothetical protein
MCKILGVNFVIQTWNQCVGDKIKHITLSTTHIEALDI